MTRVLVIEHNAAAFLDMIAHSEIGERLQVVSDDGYNVLVGSTPSHPLLCSTYAQHPHVLNRMLNSTAAGRYQFIYATWVAATFGLGLTDFSPESQDRACVWLLKQCGAYLHLIAGDFDAALARASTQWASLPGSKAEQHVNAYSDLLAVYLKAGGTTECARVA